jgi:hypothetical protein
MENSKFHFLEIASQVIKIAGMFLMLVVLISIYLEEVNQTKLLQAIVENYILH